MVKLICLVGLPGSGKSTWAKMQVEASQGKTKRINNDDLREMLDNGIWSKSNEKSIGAIRDMLIMHYLANGYNVIVDNLNLAPKHEPHYRQLAEDMNAEFEVNDSFLSVDVNECIYRDSKREKPVGKKVILENWARYLKPKPYEFTKGLPECVICDLDGTLALFDDNPYNRDFSKDKPSPQVVELLTNNYQRGCMVIFLSGRVDSAYDVTHKWILDNTPLATRHFELHMRPKGDVRTDHIIKRELFDTYVRGKYNPVYVIDDRLQVCRLWASLGIFVFNVNQFNLEF